LKEKHFRTEVCVLRMNASTIHRKWMQIMTKEELGMDLLMLGILVVCFLLLKLFADWCGRQVEKS